MLNNKPVSELRNYKQLLAEVTLDQPVILTKNGYGKYAVVNLEAYDRFQASLALLKDLKAAEKEPTRDTNAVFTDLLKDL
ncbi:type II toxin-antitoxin system prevent-host-death family antitoxin [Loigolactobacillus zhaoyuanensis]|uniref:Antitoxin n=1 Tax=Loigolactobacillus zhaoyuanensis TaxID=2486017 RepID=A0ABW8UEZ1_9LACO|nr:type II toxin-antitoxin system prevent-host-death family antitoxin [Loigolactobacillus zhaoyuanensis]